MVIGVQLSKPPFWWLIKFREFQVEIIMIKNL